MTYLINHQGQQVGPFTATEIVARINARELELLDYAFDAAQNDWVLLTDLREVAELLKARKPSLPPRPVAAQVAPELVATVEWFVLKGENRLGPYTSDQVVGLCQQKLVYPFDFAWREGLGDWTRVAEVPEFKPERVRDLFRSDDSVFIKRQFVRQAFAAPVLVHDTMKLWRGRAHELSGGGVGVRLDRAARVTPGQTLNLHCGAQDGMAAFNAACEVVSVVVSSDDGSIECGLRFVSLSQDARATINAKVA